MDRLISLQAAIDALGDEPEVWTGKDEYAQGLNNQWHYDRNAIKALPSTQPEQQWIPCSERLPKNGRQVLVYARSVHYALAKYDEMREADGTYKKQWVTFDAWKPFYTIKDVLAWRELPEPWRGESNDRT